MITYPYINPIAFTLGKMRVYWYSLMYLIGFCIAWMLAKWRVRRYNLPWSSQQISDLIFFGALGVILGGRIGYMLFYNPAHLWADPASIYRVWQGGMSFHGGLIGVVIASWLCSLKIKKPFLEIMDFTAPLAPLGLAAGRIGNFINGELWGRQTSAPWGMIFPRADGNIRHPSQLYEFTLEGILLFIFVWWYASKPRPRGCVTAIFLMGYAIARSTAELFREPDFHIGFLANGWLTMGQLLSLPMFLVGALLWWAKRHEKLPTVH